MSRLGNGLKTALLLGGLSALILLIGQALGGTTGLLIAGVIALGMNGVSYFYSDRLALRAMRAEQVSPQQAPWLHAMVAELATRQGLPRRGYTSARRRHPTRSPLAATRRTRQSVSPRASSSCSTSASCAASWATKSAMWVTGTFSSPRSPLAWPAW
jgi:hypothetical protein